MAEGVEFLPGFVTDAVSGSLVMSVVGVIEIAAGIGVWLRPRVFAQVVAAWLGVIIVTLVIKGGFWDIVLRDFGLLLGAVALWRLARATPDRDSAEGAHVPVPGTEVDGALPDDWCGLETGAAEVERPFHFRGSWVLQGVRPHVAETGGGHQGLVDDNG